MSPHRFQLAPSIQRLLRQTRRLLRAYVWLQGAAAALVAIGLAFWVSLGFDWMFEPSSAVRRGFAAIVALALLGLLYWVVLRRAFVRLSWQALAVLVERRRRDFADSLITAVEMAADNNRLSACDRALLEATHQRAAVRAAPLDAASLFDWRPVRRSMALAATAVISVSVFAFAAHDAFGIWQRRALRFSEELWPRRTQLLVEGFVDRDTIKVALGSDLDLVVLAAAGVDNWIPNSVEVRTIESLPRRDAMSREGQATPGVDAHQRYTHSFKAVFSSFDFYVVGGDARLGPLHVEAVESPSLGDVTLRCNYPKYTGLEDRELNVAGLMQLPVGSRLNIHARANKPLKQAQIEVVATDAKMPPQMIDFGDTGQREIDFELPRLDRDQTLQFTLWDTDGIRSREPARISLSALADETPQVEVSAQGIGRAITPQARIPIFGKVRDDYGLAKTWLELSIDDAAPRESLATLAAPGTREIAVNEWLDITDWKLSAKQKLQWAFRASDACDLDEGAHTGASPRFVLELVTPDQLLVLLQSRELTLRRRFETMIQDLIDTRNLLAKVKLSGDVVEPPTSATRPYRRQASAIEQLAAALKMGADQDSRGADAVGREPSLSDAESTARRLVQTERVAQNLQRTQQEIGEVADAFAGIHAELVNNRMDNDDHRSRLVDGIVTPLVATRSATLPAAISQMQELRAHLDDRQASVLTRQSTILLIDRVLSEMNSVLTNMIQLETLNEMAALLRDIIETQEKITAKTKDQQRRRLLDDE